MQEATATTAPRLYRRTNDKIIAGVCGGLADYFRIDPLLVRLAFIIFAVTGGASILVYVALWIAIPAATADGTAVTSSRGVSGETAGIVLVGIGGAWLLANLGVFDFVNWKLAWPVVLIALGLGIVFRRSRP